ncbi:hypothetical protein T439DRAFT_378605 [Meredithblackwellia eburnea MCA 4105]
MAADTSALSPINPANIPHSEREEKAAWLVRKLMGTLAGRITLASFESIRSSGLSIICLSPWGDAVPLMLPCIRLRDVAVHAAITATGGTAAFASPFFGSFSDVVVGSLGESIMVQVGTVVAWDLGHKAATDLLFDKATKLIPDQAKFLTTTSVKELTVTIHYKHHTLTDALLGFFRASSVVHPDPSLFATVGEYLSTQKGWFAPYLQSSARRPVIPRNFSPDVIFSHGPFIKGDYALGLRLRDEAATLLNLASTTTPPTFTEPNQEGKEAGPVVYPRKMLMTVVGLAPHRFGMWTSSARPEESVIKYQLLNGCPALVVPVLPGAPLVAWHTSTLEALHAYKTELDKAGNVKPGSIKFQNLVDAIFEFLSLCVDFNRVQLPALSSKGVAPKKSDATLDPTQACLREAVALVLEGAIRSGLPDSLKVLKEDVDLSRAGIAFWRII